MGQTYDTSSPRSTDTRRQAPGRTINRQRYRLARRAISLLARHALEAGGSIIWLQRQLGHSSITVTVDVYGHREDAARKQEAERPAEAFAL